MITLILINLIVLCIIMLTLTVYLLIMYRNKKSEYVSYIESLSNRLLLRINENIVLQKQNDILITEVIRLTKKNNFCKFPKEFSYKNIDKRLYQPKKDIEIDNLPE